MRGKFSDKSAWLDLHPAMPAGPPQHRGSISSLAATARRINTENRDCSEGQLSIDYQRE